MSQHIVYLSDDWFALLEAEATRAYDAVNPPGSGVRFSLLERYRNAPLRADGTHPGFRIEFDAERRAQVRPGAGADETADCILDVSIDGARRLVSQLSGPGLDALLVDLLGADDLKLTGALESCPVDVASFHDRVVMQTRLD